MKLVLSLMLLMSVSAFAEDKKPKEEGKTKATAENEKREPAAALAINTLLTCRVVANRASAGNIIEVCNGVIAETDMQILACCPAQAGGGGGGMGGGGAAGPGR